MIALIKFHAVILLVAGVITIPQASYALTNNFSLWEAVFLGTQNNQIVKTAGETRQRAAEKFISTMGDEAIGFLSNSNLSVSQKEQEFRKLLNRNFDMDTISRFALGRNWQTASAAQKKEYQSLVNNMIVEVYSQRFNDYQGESFEVKSSQPTGKSDYLVSSVIVPEGGSKVKVDWRVRDNNGRFKIVDVIVEGVSMTLTQRSEFASVIQRGGGDVDALIAHLKK